MPFLIHAYTEPLWLPSQITRVTTALQRSSEAFTGSFWAGTINVFSLIHPEITWEKVCEKTDSELCSELGMIALR